MGKALQSFGSSRTDQVVKSWLDAKGIDPKDVMAYRITRAGDGQSIPTIELTMIYDDDIETEVPGDGVSS